MLTERQASQSEKLSFHFNLSLHCAKVSVHQRFYKRTTTKHDL